MGWNDNLNTENADLLPGLLSDAELIDYIKKIKSLPIKERYKLYGYIDNLVN